MSFAGSIRSAFATLAFAIETLNRARFAGDITRLKTIEVRFTRPLVLAKDVGVFIKDGEIYVGDAPGGPAYLTGTYETQQDNGQ